ncbi:EmrB/QacA subfamily drug resistance transporter [Gracilibacillus halotolerans]|uniref:EmrB/QacA subfamily drug resistance transporter n=1 Tax=Gracilibacillus halotolerans TaxID=74386 RepID=A0A841RNL3_9BACI|nr:MDR family MFS transporter [Gracilibacillus halotolerans]MBB6513193.1 EmrB/QacA subfamily drug resistance transporter [Gracilibacillus halotolerans]
MVAKETKRPLVLLSLMLAMFMAAIEGTIVATAIPNIVADLGGFSLYSWVFSSFLLMQAVTTMFYGKLADIFGRKPIFIIGITIFLIGSFLCGLAPTMGWLIFFRFVQGFGAGAMQPIVTTIVGDMYTLEERAKVQGYLSSVWGISSVSGPLIGGLIVQYVDWAWIFWMNIPLGILGLIGVIVFFHEKVDREKQTIDYGGSALFFIAISALIIVFIQAGTAWNWLSTPVLTLILVFIVATLLFLRHERNHPAPMMPLYLWKNKLMVIANSATFLAGMIILGLSSFLPTYVQAVMGMSPIIAGFTLSTMSIGWPIAATAAGHLIIKIGFRKTAILGGTCLLLGSSLFLLLDAEKGPIFAGISSFIIGIGMGLANTSFIVSIQNSVGWKERGIATSLNMFMRIIGSAVGAALLGGILNTTLMNYLNNKNMDTSLSNTEILLDETMRQSLPVQTIIDLQTGLSEAIHMVFTVLFIIGLATFVILLFFPAIKIKKSDE